MRTATVRYRTDSASSATPTGSTAPSDPRSTAPVGGGGGGGGKGGGGFLHLLAPTPELWALVLSHWTQILYIADISLVVTYLELVPGCVVLKSGTSSGSLTTSLARAVAPHRRVCTFDFHGQRAASARTDGIGLSAPQVGVNAQLMLFNPAGVKGEGEEIVLVNPVVYKF